MAAMMQKQSSGTVIEKPECIRIDFSTSTDGETLTFGYYLYPHVASIELDGSAASFSYGSEGAVVMTVVSAGDHVMYITLQNAIKANHGLTFKYNASLVRFPYNASTMILGNVSKQSWSLKWDVIEILDSALFASVTANAYATFSSADSVRVPVGASQQYVDAGYRGTNLEEVNFVYTI